MIYKLIEGENRNFEKLFRNSFAESEGESAGITIEKLVQELISTTPKDEIYKFAALHNNKIVGAVIFTKIRFEESDINTFILSPAAVDTEFQRQGIGQALINYAFEFLKKHNIKLILSYGDIKFYSKLGFKQIGEDTIKAPLKLSFPHGWIAKPLSLNKIPKINSKSYCVSALNNQIYW
ncbi:MAG: GNAT family N-acetyltransferase [Marinifilaceae bacterium]|jgi:predicted N-acetyltransferase YhbS|nr:GNAT family N-acetyltransferase [Marinifilaceae bacterium]